MSGNIMVETPYILRRLKPNQTKEGDFDTMLYEHIKRGETGYTSYLDYVVAAYEVAIENREFLGKAFIDGLIVMLPRRANLVNTHFQLYVESFCKLIEQTRSLD